MRSDSKRKGVYSMSSVLWDIHTHSHISTILNLYLKLKTDIKRNGLFTQKPSVKVKMDPVSYILPCSVMEPLVSIPKGN